MTLSPAPTDPAHRNTAIEASTRPDYDSEKQAAWLQRHQDLVALARGGGIDVAFFGDSLTEQWTTTGRAEWEQWFVPLGAGNFGVSGDRTQQVLWRMSHGELDGIAPRLFVLLIGTNNTDPGLGENSLTRANSTPEIIAGVAAIVSLVHTRLPNAKILLHGLLPRGPATAPIREQIAAINAGLRRLDDDGRSLRFVDFGPLFLEPDNSIRPEIMPDQLHLSAAGYEIWARALIEPVTAMLRSFAPNHAPPAPPGS
jgi:Lysophospholipase L1 and related esterases